MSLSPVDVAAYVFWKMGCIHPFIASRVIALYEMLYYEKNGEWPLSLKYVAGPGVFYIEGFKEIISGNECFVTKEGDPVRGIHGCIEYRCNPPEIPPEHRKVLEDAIKRAIGKELGELNKLVVQHPLYKSLLERGRV